jgi:uncharacterized protein (DUF1697 family)
MRYAAFLRAVNVGGNALSMAALKAMLADLGFERTKTLLQSGNVVFEASKRADARLETLLQRETEQRLGVRTEYFIRDACELQQIVEANPFEREAIEQPSRLAVVVLRQSPSALGLERLRNSIRGPELVAPGIRHVYITYPAGQADTKLTNAVIERALETRGTARNWNTILKMQAALDGGSL